MSRYSVVKRGAQLNAALTSYTTYLSTPRKPKLGTRGNRAAQVAAVVVPFTIDPAGDGVACRTSKAGSDHLKDSINGVTGAKVVTGGDISGTNDTLRGFRPARVVTFEHADISHETVESKVTQTPYLKYAGTRYACVFGRPAKTDTHKETTIFEAIKVVLLARTGIALNRVSLSPERVRP